MAHANTSKRHNDIGANHRKRRALALPLDGQPQPSLAPTRRPWQHNDHFSAALLAIVIGLVMLRITEQGSQKPRILLHTIVGITVLIVGISSMVQIYRVADPGGPSVSDEEITRMEQVRVTQQATETSGVQRHPCAQTDLRWSRVYQMAYAAAIEWSHRGVQGSYLARAGTDDRIDSRRLA